jgi:hypothetical protein
VRGGLVRYSGALYRGRVIPRRASLSDSGFFVSELGAEADAAAASAASFSRLCAKYSSRSSGLSCARDGREARVRREERSGTRGTLLARARAAR